MLHDIRIKTYVLCKESLGQSNDNTSVAHEGISIYLPVLMFLHLTY